MVVSKLQSGWAYVVVWVVWETPSGPKAVSGCWMYIVLVQKHPLAGPLIAVQFSGENNNLWLTGFVTALTYVFFWKQTFFSDYLNIVLSKTCFKKSNSQTSQTTNPYHPYHHISTCRHN